ncbi:MAG: WYL domain-containing protein [Bradymonadales bacterium]|nr:WYL domain-containing protein [Bradymonadales bacterium]
MPDSPISLNLAQIVHRLLTCQRGWRVQDLMQQLDVADRTYRKYRQLLQEQFLPFRRSDGTSMVREVGQGESRWLRLAEVEERTVASKDFAGRVAALNFAQQMFSFVRDTELGQAMASLVEEFRHSLRDRPFVLGHLLRNVDRLFYVVPDAPKDYSGKKKVVGTLIKALLFTQRIDITYHSATGGLRTLDLEPLALVSHRSALYLLGHCPQYTDVRIYAVDRIERAQQRSERFEYPGPASFDPRQYIEGCFGIYHDDSTEPIVVELIFQDIRWLKIYLKERRWHPTQQFEDLPDGRLRMTFTVSTMVEVWPWIRSFGEDVELIRPAGPIPMSSRSDQPTDPET